MVFCFYNITVWNREFNYSRITYHVIIIIIIIDSREPSSTKLCWQSLLTKMVWHQEQPFLVSSRKNIFSLSYIQNILMQIIMQQKGLPEIYFYLDQTFYIIQLNPESRWLWLKQPRWKSEYSIAHYFSISTFVPCITIFNNLLSTLLYRLFSQLCLYSEGSITFTHHMLFCCFFYKDTEWCFFFILTPYAPSWPKESYFNFFLLVKKVLFRISRGNFAQ